MAELYGVPHVATGDILRRHVAERTPLGLEAGTYMARGDLVPDALVVALIASEIAGPEPLPGFVLDGYPRTLAQAEAAYRWAKRNDKRFHAAISLAVPEDELVRRLLLRGHQEGRMDDTEETILRRLRVFNEQTEPLLDFYRSREIVLEVDGTGSVEEVTLRVKEGLDALDPNDG